jgi:hypothetical protein
MSSTIVSTFLQLSILNKTRFFFSKKGFFSNSFFSYPFEQDMWFFNYPLNKMWFSARRVSTPGFSISSAIHFEQDIISEQQGFFLLHFLNFFTCPLNKEMNEYSSLKEAMTHGKGESAIRFLEHKLQLCQLSSSSSSSHLVGGWSLRREETRE